MIKDPEDYEPDDYYSVPVDMDGIDDDERWDDNECSNEFLK